jgi:hypothetical protein
MNSALLSGEKGGRGRYRKILNLNVAASAQWFLHNPAGILTDHDSLLASTFSPDAILMAAESRHSFPSRRTPASRVKHPFVSLPRPSCWHPDGTSAGWENPSSRNPHVSSSIPALISRNPSVTWMWRGASNRCGAMRRGWGGGANNNLRQRHLRCQCSRKECNTSEERFQRYLTKG